ncbi:cobalamin-binding protein [Celerinatantimonas yamalensis]|uniref:Cobalamin-binding protein n=1 Tax=Celerinatantimonas yamalensis TaxID=559956 RepID=A0ABW9GA92_9GAMM
MLCLNRTAYGASQRLIALAPNLTEAVYALGAGSQLVGVIAHSDYPPQAQTKAVVGDYQHLDIERIIALRPSLVLSWSAGNPNAGLNALKQFAIPMADFSPKHLRQLPEFFQRLGDAIHRPKQGQKLAKQLHQELTRLRAQYQHQPHVRVFYQIWHQPLITVSDHSWINDAIALCGGVNIFADSPLAYPQVNLEQVLSRAPQAIILSNRDQQGRQLWQHWQSATLHPTLLSINPDWLSRFGPRLIKGVQQLCESIDSVRNKQKKTPLRPAG